MQALQAESLRHFVVHEQFMTPTAKFADLTDWESPNDPLIEVWVGGRTGLTAVR